MFCGCSWSVVSAATAIVVLLVFPPKSAVRHIIPTVAHKVPLLSAELGDKRVKNENKGQIEGKITDFLNVFLIALNEIIKLTVGICIYLIFTPVST